jgi:hypothetical protein
MASSQVLVIATNATSAAPGIVQIAGDFGGSATTPLVTGINGVPVTGTPTAGQVLTASSGTAAAWATPAGTTSTAKRVVTDTYSATLTPNSTTTDIYRITLTGSPTLATPSGTPVDGQQMQMNFIQDGSGSRVITYSTGYSFSTDIPSPTLTTTPGATDILGFQYASASGKWRLLGLVKGF